MPWRRTLIAIKGGKAWNVNINETLLYNVIQGTVSAGKKSSLKDMGKLGVGIGLWDPHSFCLAPCIKIRPYATLHTGSSAEAMVHGAVYGPVGSRCCGLVLPLLENTAGWRRGFTAVSLGSCRQSAAIITFHNSPHNIGRTGNGGWNPRLSPLNNVSSLLGSRVRVPLAWSPSGVWS